MYAFRVALCDTLCACVRDDDDVSYAAVCLPCVSDAEPTYSWLSVFVSHPPPSNVLSLSGTKVGSTEVSQGDGVLQQSDATEAFAVMAPIMACWFNVCRTAGVCRSGKASGGGRVG